MANEFTYSGVGYGYGYVLERRTGLSFDSRIQPESRILITNTNVIPLPGFTFSPIYYCVYRNPNNLQIWVSNTSIPDADETLANVVITVMPPGCEIVGGVPIGTDSSGKVIYDPIIQLPVGVICNSTIIALAPASVTSSNSTYKGRRIVFQERLSAFSPVGTISSSKILYLVTANYGSTNPTRRFRISYTIV
jgi:hypothetical protein